MFGDRSQVELYGPQHGAIVHVARVLSTASFGETAPIEEPRSLSDIRDSLYDYLREIGYKKPTTGFVNEPAVWQRLLGQVPEELVVTDPIIIQPDKSSYVKIALATFPGNKEPNLIIGAEKGIRLTRETIGKRECAHRVGILHLNGHDSTLLDFTYGRVTPVTGSVDRYMAEVLDPFTRDFPRVHSMSPRRSALSRMSGRVLDRILHPPKPSTH